MDFAKEVDFWLRNVFKNANVSVKGSIKQPWDALKLLKKLEIEKEILKGQIETGVKWDVPLVLGKNSKIKAPSRIEGPVLVGENTIIGPFAYVRGPAIIGDDCRVGSSEIKNSILMDGACASHFAYVGDSVLGRNVNLGAGAKLANLRLDGRKVKVMRDKLHSSGLEKLGAILEDSVQVGCNAVLNPGTYAKKNAKVLPCAMVRGLVKERARRPRPGRASR